MAEPVEILLIEDNPGDVELVQRALRLGKISNRLIIFAYGHPALAYLQADPNGPQLIVLDLNLPDMSGLDVLATLKANTALRRIPVVVMTSSESEADVLHSYELQASGYVVKPFAAADFVRTVLDIESYWLSIVRLPPT